jgi:hypothetical protein
LRGGGGGGLFTLAEPPGDGSLGYRGQTLVWCL